MAPEQTNAKRHGPNRATTVICLVLILAAALVIARMVKFRSQVDVTLPAVLWEDGEATAVNTTLHFHGEMVKQWGQDDSFSGYLELEEQPFTSEEASKVWLTMAHEGGGLNRGLLEYGKFPAHTFFGKNCVYSRSVYSSPKNVWAGDHPGLPHPAGGRQDPGGL